jgi:hypothetical protein
MPEQRAAECRNKAQECRDEAARALNDADRQSWLRMADEWMALARSAEETAALNKRADAQNGQNSG